MTLPVAVVGAGHLGTFHARIWHEHPRARLVGLVDPDRERVQALADELGVRCWTSAEELPSEVRAASVAVPTRLHAEVAVPLLERGVACLIEKPLAASLEEADRILGAAERTGATLSVGHVERFQPGLRRVREMGVHPRFIECHRLAPFSFRSTDVGVVHDLMIHDLDLILHLVGEAEVELFDAAGGAILTQHEDVASARLVFSDGSRANVTASRVALEPMRRFRLFSGESYISLDFHKNYGLLVRKGPRWQEGVAQLGSADARELAKRPDFLTAGVLEVTELELGGRERPLQAELDAFLGAVVEGRPPEVSGGDGRRALALAERITAAIHEEGW